MCHFIFSACAYINWSFITVYGTGVVQRRYDKLIRAYAPTSKSHDTHGIPDILSSYYNNYSSIVVYSCIVMVATTQVVVDSLVLAISVARIVLLPALVARVDVLDVESP